MTLKYCANLWMLYNEVPFLDRFARAAQAGFSTVEFLSPYEDGIEAVKAHLEEHDLKVALFNLPAGDLANGEWGTLSNPYRREYFKKSCLMAIEAARALGCNRLNTMFGHRVGSVDLEEQIEVACENLAWAAPMAAEAGVDLLIEPLNPIDFPNYALIRTTTAIEIIRRVNHPRVRLQYDIYHAQMGEGNLINTLSQNISDISHIQLADVPGRHQPGTGEIRFPAVFEALERLGYVGYIGLEYRPLGETDESLSWLPRSARDLTGLQDL